MLKVLNPINVDTKFALYIILYNFIKSKFFNIKLAAIVSTSETNNNNIKAKKM